MSDASVLVRDDQLIAEAIAAAAVSGNSFDLTTANSPAEQAACAIIAGLQTNAGATAALVELIDDDHLGSQAAAWALGLLDSETQLSAILDGGSLDQREHAYRALAIIAARDAASDQLAPLMLSRVDIELERASKGMTSLAEHATKVLAILGSDGVIDQIQRVVEQDQFADRFELQRQRKQVESNGKDTEGRDELLAEWTELFADDLAAADQPAAAGEPAESEPAAPQMVPEPAAEPAPIASEPPPLPPAANPMATAAADLVPDVDTEATGETDDAAVEDPAADAKPVDWDSFFASEEFAALDERTTQLAQQLAPMLEQLTAQVAQIPLTALAGQELAGLLLQVLPQAAPPQVVQAALSPEALNAYQALATFLVRTEAALHPDLIDGVKLVRQTMREQIRQSGMLGGPDYSDPDEAVTDEPPNS